MRTRPTKRYLIPILAAILVLTSGLIAGCGQKATSTEIYRNYQYGYMIEYPSSWTLDDSGETVHISRPLHEYITVGVLEGKQLTTEDLEWLFDNMVKEMATSTEDFQLISKTSLYDIGHPAWQIVWSGKTNEGLAVKAKTRCIAYEDKVYVITASAPGIELPSELETALRSFCFLEEYIYDTKLDEKQVIEMAYDYLVIKAEQLQGYGSWLNKIRLRTVFREALIKAVLEESDEPDSGLGDLVYLQFTKPEPWEMSIFTSELEKIVKYDGNRWWSLSVGDWEWYFDERTRKVIAQNEEAASLLEEITLKTYHNSRYGYYVDYPPSWTIHEEGNKNVLIFTGSPEEVKAFIFIGVIEEEELATYKGLQGYIEATLRSLKSQYHEFEVTEASPTRIDYTYMLSEHVPKHEARRYFVQHEHKVYDIVCSAELTAFGEHYSLSSLYDPFDSFWFQP